MHSVKKGFTSMFAVNIHPQKINTDLPINTTTSNILVWAFPFLVFMVVGIATYPIYNLLSLKSSMVLYNFLWNVIPSFLMVSWSLLQDPNHHPITHTSSICCENNSHKVIHILYGNEIS